MAFNPNAQAAMANVANMFGAQQQQDDSWKAQGFLNIYLPTTQGGRRKIGTIYLHENKQMEKQLIERLKADPEAVIEALLGKIEMEFNEAGGNTTDSFDI